MLSPGSEEDDDYSLSIVRQVELVSISRSLFYREPTGAGRSDAARDALIDQPFLETPWCGSRGWQGICDATARALGIILCLG